MPGPPTQKKIDQKKKKKITKKEKNKEKVLDPLQIFFCWRPSNVFVDPPKDLLFYCKKKIDRKK